MNRPPHAGLRHLALNVREMDAMKRFYADLLGFEVEWEPNAGPRTHHDGARSCYVRDPDGNKAQIIHYSPISQKI